MSGLFWFLLVDLLLKVEPEDSIFPVLSNSHVGYLLMYIMLKNKMLSVFQPLKQKQIQETH